jgi:hypothetical protein
MDRAAEIARLDEQAAELLRAFHRLGLVAAMIHEIDDDQNFSLLYPDHLLVRPMLERAVKHLERKEAKHLC